MSLKALASSLRDEPAPVYLMLGDAPLLVERAVKAVVDAALPRCGVPAFNYATFRASDGNAVAAVAAARTLPMMADRRLVVLLEVEQADDQALLALSTYAEAPPETTVLVIAGSGFRKVVKGQKAYGIRLRNRVKKTGRVLKLSAEDVSPAQVAAEHAESLGAVLGWAEARLLVELVGNDLGVVCREVEKVMLYAPVGSPITEAAIHAACSNVAEAVIWDLTAGLAARDANGALAAMHRLLDGGGAPQYLLAMVTWQLRIVLQVSAMVRAGASDKVIVRAVNMRWESYRRLRSVLGRGFPGAADTLEHLAAANRSMNRHKAGGRRVLEELVMSLCSS